MLDDLIKQYLVTQAKVDPARLADPQVKMSELGLDSLGLIEMLFEVEDHYGFQVSDPMRFQNMRLDEMIAAIEDEVRAQHGGVIPDLASTRAPAKTE